MAEKIGNLHAARCGLEVLNGFVASFGFEDLSMKPEDFPIGLFVLYKKMVEEIRVAEKGWKGEK